MKTIIQRVKHASVRIENKIQGEIGSGLLVYVCFEIGDTHDDILAAVDKITKLRVFEDESQKMNLNVQETGGSILSISQFTLSWDGRKGHRPSFDRSMPPSNAKIMYHTFNKELQNQMMKVQTGIFGANMQVESINDGPVTFFLSWPTTNN